MHLIICCRINGRCRPRRLSPTVIFGIFPVRDFLLAPVHSDRKLSTGSREIRISFWCFWEDFFLKNAFPGALAAAPFFFIPVGGEHLFFFFVSALPALSLGKSFIPRGGHYRKYSEGRYYCLRRSSRLVCCIGQWSCYSCGNSCLSHHSFLRSDPESDKFVRLQYDRAFPPGFT